MGPDLAHDLRSQLWRPRALDVWPPDWGRVSPVVGSPQSVVLCPGSPKAQTHWDLITKARLTAHETCLSPVPLGVTPSPRAWTVQCDEGPDQGLGGGLLEGEHEAPNHTEARGGDVAPAASSWPELEPVGSPLCLLLLLAAFPSAQPGSRCRWAKKLA